LADLSRSLAGTSSPLNCNDGNGPTLLRGAAGQRQSEKFLNSDASVSLARL
jgi:hypothetical protein